MTDDTRVKANEPKHEAGRAVPSGGQGQPHGITPREDADAESAIGQGTAGDGVAFFEGGDGREEARADIEREG